MSQPLASSSEQTGIDLEVPNQNRAMFWLSVGDTAFSFSSGVFATSAVVLIADKQPELGIVALLAGTGSFALGALNQLFLVGTARRNKKNELIMAGTSDNTNQLTYQPDITSSSKLLWSKREVYDQDREW